MNGSILARYLTPEVLQQLAAVAFEPGRLVAGRWAGAHRGLATGFAVEFSGRREYAPGDDPRRIDWRAFFAREKLYVKQYDIETDLTCHLVLDTSASMGYGEAERSKWRLAARLATCLAYAILKQRDRVSLTMASDQVESHLPPTAALGQVLRIVGATRDQRPRGAGVSETLRALAERFGRREVVAVVSDFLTDLDSLEHAVRRLQHDRHEVHLIQVLDRDELEFPFHDTVRFSGLEQPSATAVIDAAAERASYLAALRDHQQGLQALALRRQCAWALLRTDEDLGTAVQNLLRRRRAQGG